MTAEPDEATIKEIIKVLLTESRHYVAEIYWAQNAVSAESVLRNGSCFFLNGGSMSPHEFIISFFQVFRQRLASGTNGDNRIDLHLDVSDVARIKVAKGAIHAIVATAVITLRF